MNYIDNLKKFTILFLFLFQFASVSFAQTVKFSEPRQEKLLNGMKLLVWNAPDAPKVSVKLRVHNGSAFDPQGKEGVMALLAEALFPNESQKEFFIEDLGGSLAVTSNFDYLEINATANAEQFLTLMETLANAVTNPQINKETTAKVVAARLEKVKELEKSPSYIADRAVAKKLFGDFPYGRAQMGTSASLAKIDFADLIFARQRFLTADNATLAIVGNVKPDLAFRVVRRFFGAWEKADKKVPATFRQPDAPDTKLFSIEMPNAANGLWRSAMMTAARNDKDFYATKILTEVWRNQFCYNDESKNGKSSFEPHLLSGIYVISKNHLEELTASARSSCEKFFVIKEGKSVYPPIGQSIFEKAKSSVIAELNQKMSTAIDSTDLWLDVDTYKLVSVKDEIQKANNVTLTDVQRVAETLQKQPFVNVIIKNSVGTKQ